jgi:hypothetical protein
LEISRRSSRITPCPPKGRVEWSEVLPLAGEEKGTKTETLGVAHPPIIYKPSEWLWKSSDDVKKVLLRALQISNARVTLEDITAEKTTKALKRLKGIHPGLYHPCDREALKVFDAEHMISCTARSFGRGVVVVGPEVSKDGQSWGAWMNPDPKQRFAIRARHSTGDQEEFPPIILGFVPTSKDEGIWFYLEPTEAMAKRYREICKGYVLKHSYM